MSLSSEVVLVLATVACAYAGVARAADGDEAPLSITRAGVQASTKGANPTNFSGAVRVDLLHAAMEPGHVSAAYVTFEPGARSVWHTHPAAQNVDWLEPVVDAPEAKE